VDGTPLEFVSDYELDEGDAVIWEHLVFSQESGGALLMTARIPCPQGLLFPLGWVLLAKAARGAMVSGAGDWGHIIPVEMPGLSVPVDAYLDTDPGLSQQIADANAGLILPLSVLPGTVLGSYLLKATPLRIANVEIVNLAGQFRRGGPRFTGNAAGYYFRPVRDIAAGESFIVDWEFFVQANQWEAVSPESVGRSGPLGQVSGLLTFRRVLVPAAVPAVDMVVPPVASVMEGLPALGRDVTGSMSPSSGNGGLGDRGGRSSSPTPVGGVPGEDRAPLLPTDGSSVVHSGAAVVGAELGGSSVCSAAGEGSLKGGTDRCTSPAYYPTGGDPLTHSAHLIPSPGTREHEAAGGESKSTDNDPRNIKLACPLGFVRGPNARNWLVEWDNLWDEIDEHFGGVPTSQQRRDLQRFRKQEKELYDRFLSSSRAPEAPSARKRGLTSARPANGSDPTPSKRTRTSPRASSVAPAVAPTVVDSSRQGRWSSLGASPRADRLRGADVHVLRARYETALEGANAAEARLMAAARSSDAAVASASLAHDQALSRAADVYAQLVRSARHAYTSAVEVNNLAQGALLDARDRLTAAWEAEDGDEGLSAGSEDSEGSVASEG
jgi:hypothetical protein